MGSGAELSYRLLLARDLGLMKESEYSMLETALDEVVRMLSSLSTRLHKSLAA
jgi:four helix bundle protein